MKRPRRHLIAWGAAIATASLLLGLATAVAVAARGAYGRSVQSNGVYSAGDLAEVRGIVVRKRMALWDIHLAQLDINGSPRLESLARADWRAMMVRGLAASERTSDWYKNSGSTGSTVLWVEDYGWPLRSFYTFDVRDAGGSRLAAANENQWALPFAPGPALWWPLLLNTLIFAAPWLLLLSLPPSIVLAVRNRRRRRVGHCPVCNYDCTGIAKEALCPECGNAQPPH